MSSLFGALGCAWLFCIGLMIPPTAMKSASFLFVLHIYFSVTSTTKVDNIISEFMINVDYPLQSCSHCIGPIEALYRVCTLVMISTPARLNPDS